MSGAGSRSLPRRLATAAGGLFLGLVLCELTLQLLALAVGGGRGGAGAGDGGLTVLAHGDSNVYGVYVPERDSYPARLERLLDGGEEGPHRVVNLGIPGLNSRQLAGALPSEIERLRPDLVLITIGANNTWTWTPDADAVVLEPPVWERLRLVRLGRILWARTFGGVDGGEEDPSSGGRGDALDEGAGDGAIARTMRYADGRSVQVRVGEADATADDRRQERGLIEDLGTVAAVCAEAEVPLWLVGYGANAGTYRRANELLDEASEALGVPLVETWPYLDALAAERGHSEVLFIDLHPRASGYELIARAVHDAIVEAGLHEGPATLGLPLQDAPEHGAGGPRWSLEAVAGDEPRIDVAGGPPDRPFSLVLFHVTFGELPPSSDSFADVGLDPVFRQTLGERPLRGRFDAEGRASVSLAPVLEPPYELDGLRMRAVVVLEGLDDPDRVTGLSDPIEVGFD